jgi:hypothetical protein
MARRTELPQRCAHLASGPRHSAAGHSFGAAATMVSNDPGGLASGASPLTRWMAAAVAAGTTRVGRGTKLVSDAARRRQRQSGRSAWHTDRPDLHRRYLQQGFGRAFCTSKFHRPLQRGLALGAAHEAGRRYQGCRGAVGRVLRVTRFGRPLIGSAGPVGLLEPCQQAPRAKAAAGEYSGCPASAATAYFPRGRPTFPCDCSAIPWRYAVSACPALNVFPTKARSERIRDHFSRTRPPNRGRSPNSPLRSAHGATGTLPGSTAGFIGPDAFR